MTGTTYDLRVKFWARGESMGAVVGVLLGLLVGTFGFLVMRNPMRSQVQIILGFRTNRTQLCANLGDQVKSHAQRSPERERREEILHAKAADNTRILTDRIVFSKTESYFADSRSLMRSSRRSTSCDPF